MDYKTVASVAKGSYTEKKSEFIAVIKPVATNDEAVEFINEIKAQHRKARHNVYAYILREGAASRYSDDGEPSGTAGVPVLDVLQKNGLTDICCVVTRYFGGVLLGANGLVRAYSTACKTAVENASIKLMQDAVKMDIACSYNLYGKLSYVLPEFEVKILDTQFGSDVSITLLAKAELLDKLEKKLVDITSGQIDIVKSDIFEADFS